MTSKRLVKIYRQFAKELIGIDVKVKVSTSFWFSHLSKEVAVAKNVKKSEIEDLIDRYFHDRGIHYNTYIIGFLHELGHLWSDKVYKFSDEYYMEKLQEVNWLNITMDENDYTGTLEKYYQIETEKLANDFMELAINTKPDIIHKYNHLFNVIYNL